MDARAQRVHPVVRGDGGDVGGPVADAGAADRCAARGRRCAVVALAGAVVDAANAQAHMAGVEAVGIDEKHVGRGRVVTVVHDGSAATQGRVLHLSEGCAELRPIPLA